MPFQPKADEELSPEAMSILRMILEDTLTLREIDLADTAPAPVFEADR
jgi:hypothetical protein